MQIFLITGGNNAIDAIYTITRIRILNLKKIAWSLNFWKCANIRN